MNSSLSELLIPSLSSFKQRSMSLSQCQISIGFFSYMDLIAFIQEAHLCSKDGPGEGAINRHRNWHNIPRAWTIPGLLNPRANSLQGYLQIRDKRLRGINNLKVRTGAGSSRTVSVIIFYKFRFLGTWWISIRVGISSSLLDFRIL